MGAHRKSSSSVKIVYSPRFEREALVVYELIAKDKRKVAKKFLDKIKLHIETLVDNPHKGRLNTDGNRELIYKGYTIPYFLDGETIIILGIFNQNEWESKEDYGKEARE